MTISLSKSFFLQNFFCFLILSIGSLIYSLQPENRYIFFLPIIMVVFLIVRYFNFVPVSVFLIFALPYLYVPKFFFVDGLGISFWTAYQSAASINKVAILSLVFFFFFQMFLGCSGGDLGAKKKYIGIFRNGSISIVMIFVLLFVLAFGLRGETILSEVAYGVETANKSTLHEYFIAAFLVALFFVSPEKRFLHKLIFSIFMIYTLKSFIYGGRIEVMMMSLLVCYVYLNFFVGKKFYLYCAMFFGYVAVTFVGNVRSNPSVLFSPELITLHHFLSATPSGLGYISSQFGDVYHSSVRVIGLAEDGFISWIERLQSFLLVTFGMFIPSSLMPAVYNLPSYYQRSIGSGGGGLIYAHAYVWLGVLGPAFFGAFIGFLLNLFRRYNNYYINIYALMMMVTFPRWFAYYPVVLFKMCFLVVLVFFFFRLTQIISSKNNKS